MTRVLPVRRWFRGVLPRLGAVGDGSQAPAGLGAMAPTVTTSDYYTAPWYSDGGAFSLHTSMWWSTIMSFFGAQRSLAAGTGEVDAVMELAGMLGDLESRLAWPPRSRDTLLRMGATFGGKVGPCANRRSRAKVRTQEGARL